MIGTYTSIDTIFAKVQRDLGIDNFNESDFIEWAGEALEGIGAVPAYEKTVCFKTVAQYQCDIPTWTHQIIQIARDNTYSSTTELAEYCTTTSESSEEESESGSPIPVDCNGMPITDYDLAYYRPYFDLQYEYYGWMNHERYKRDYSPVRLSNHTFFNTLVCDNITDQDSNQLYDNVQDEYNIVNGDTLRFSFQDGLVAIAYYRQKIDDNGHPMIPDDYSYKTAVTKYIAMKIAEREFFNNVQGAQGKLQKLEADWHWYAGQASSKAMMPKGIDGYQDILEQRDYLLPPKDRYYGFFGKLNVAEYRKYNDPANRNITTWRRT